jgi:hypothetical protein
VRWVPLVIATAITLLITALLVWRFVLFVRRPGTHGAAEIAVGIAAAAVFAVYGVYTNAYTNDHFNGPDSGR